MVVFSASASLFLLPRAAVRRPLEPRLTVRPPLALFVAPRASPFNLFHLTLDADHMEFRGISNYATRSPFRILLLVVGSTSLPRIVLSDRAV